MGTINSALSVMAGALDADQEALNVVANNVANANTTGYTEEKPDWQENAPISVGGVLVGDGVTETGATSQRDRVLEERLDQQQQMASASSTPPLPAKKIDQSNASGSLRSQRRISSRFES